MRITSAPLAKPAPSPSQPVLWPMISTTMMRWWLWAVEWSRSMASVAMDRAVSKPKVMSVMATSLSMVLGRVITFIPICARRQAFFWVPPPPMQMSASRLWRW